MKSSIYPSIDCITALVRHRSYARPDFPPRYRNGRDSHTYLLGVCRCFLGESLNDTYESVCALPYPDPGWLYGNSFNYRSQLTTYGANRVITRQIRPIFALTIYYHYAVKGNDARIYLTRMCYIHLAPYDTIRPTIRYTI